MNDETVSTGLTSTISIGNALTIRCRVIDNDLEVSNAHGTLEDSDDDSGRSLAMSKLKLF